MGDTPLEPQKRLTPVGKFLIGLAAVTGLVAFTGIANNNSTPGPINNTAAVQPIESATPEADAAVEDTTPSVDKPTPEVSAPAAPESVQPSTNCNPNYSGCVPNVSYDLDCPDIGHQVTVTGSDIYRLDADHDGIGCDSY